MLKKIINKMYGAFKLGNFPLRLLFSKRKAVYLFGFPIHSNLGDQAQAYCITNWLSENYPEHTIIAFNWRNSFGLPLWILRKIMTSEGVIFFHSGYLMVDHHLELPIYCKVIEKFHDHRIVILPQTINLQSEATKERVVSAFNAHPNLHLLCRDEISLATAQELFPKCKLLLFPDFVTSLIGTKTYNSERNGTLFCMRNDIEAHYSKEDILGLRNRLKQHTATELSDTTIKLMRYELEPKREMLIQSMLEEFSKFKLIITDRYHGTIFSLIANTPVIVLSSADHKLSSGVKWFSEDFEDYIAYAGNLDEAYDLAIRMLNIRERAPLKPHFREMYYDQLLTKIE